MAKQKPSYDQPSNSKITLSKPIVYLSSAIVNLHKEREVSSSLDFFVKIISHICTKFDKSRKIIVDIVIKVPENNDTEESQANLLEDVLKRKDNYQAIIIAPLFTNPIKEKLEKLIKNQEVYDACPIFFIDKYIGQENGNPCMIINNIHYPFFTSNWYSGGQKIAKEVIKEIKNSKKNKAKILILKGLEGSELRIRGFTDYFDKHNQSKDISYEVKHDENFLNFTREGAIQFCKEYLSENPNIDYIFASNDEMAIGAREAIIGLKQKSLNKIKIYGFDGIQEFNRLKQNNDPNLINTIDVQIHKQVSNLIEAIEEFFTDLQGFKTKLKEKKYFLEIDPLLV